VPDRPELAIVHDGELEDVAGLLSDLGAEFVSWRKGRTDTPPPDPSRLLVIRSDLAVSLRYRRTPGRIPGAPIWIAVADQDSRTLRSFLAQAGFDFVVRRPVHAAALRTLLARALFTGKEARRARRLPVGADVSCRSGLRRFRGTLVDLSPTGCRLFLAEPAAPGSALQVQLPGDLAGDSRFGMAGKVVRLGGAEAEGGEAGEHAVALRFEPVARGKRESLVRLLAALASGPATNAASGASGARVKRAPRVLYGEAVRTLGEGAASLVALDLSRGGIRVEPGASLAVGRKLRLAIEIGAPSEPVIVVARVARDDGTRGVALRFESIEGGGERRLEQLVSRLPPLAARAEAAEATPLLARVGAALLRFSR
jgi:c-di-GMP-binding flagellar brake protein YcgR